MALLVNAPAGSAALATITALLRTLCPNVVVNPTTGAVSVPPLPAGPPQPGQASAFLGCCCIAGLVNPPNPARLVLINPLGGPATLVPCVGRPISSFAGGATINRGPGAFQVPSPAGAGAVVPGTGADSDVYIDITDNLGAGYFVVDAAGAPIDNPLDVILYHELCTGHATEDINGMSSPSPIIAIQEATVIACENGYRAAQVPPRTARVGPLGGVNPPGGPRPPR